MQEYVRVAMRLQTFFLDLLSHFISGEYIYLDLQGPCRVRIIGRQL